MEYTTKTPVERPVWKDHKIVGTVTISREDADKLNAISNGFYLGFTPEEHDLLNNGSEEMLVRAGFTK